MKREQRLEDFEAYLAIDEHALERAAAAQPDLYYRVSRKHALLLSERDMLKKQLADAEAVAENKIRHMAEVHEQRVTDKSVEAQKRMDKQVAELSDKLLGTSSALAQWNALKDAYEQRSHALSHLVNLYTHNYYGAQIEEKNKHSELARAQMRDMRRSRNDV